MYGKSQPTRFRLALFVLACFGCSWSLWFYAAGSRNLIVDLHIGKFNLSVATKSLLQWSGNFVPGLVALFLIHMDGGWSSVKQFFRDSFANVRGFRAYPPALILPLIAFLPYVLMSPTNLVSPTILLRFLTELTVNIPLAPLWEEIGWRGYLFPGIQTSLGTIRSCLVVGVIWAIWHLPLRALTAPPGISRAIFLATFCAYVCGTALLLGWLFNLARASLLPGILSHSVLNSLSNIVLIPLITGAGITPLLVTTASIWAVSFFLYYFFPVLPAGSGVIFSCAPQRGVPN